MLKKVVAAAAATEQHDVLGRGGEKAIGLVLLGGELKALRRCWR